MLPTYNSYINAFADANSKLLFFVGYSFSLTSIMWKNIQEKARMVLLAPDTTSKRLAYTDNKTFILCHDSLVRHGDLNDEELFEILDKYLKDSLLTTFIEKRRLKMFKRE